MVVVVVATNVDSQPVHSIRVERSGGPDRALCRRLGLCLCGCGRKTRLARQSDSARGIRKGEPQFYIRGHVARTKRRPPVSDDEYEVVDTGYSTPCFIWKGVPNNKGYGKVTIAGKVEYAHRRMYQERVGPIPERMQIDHLCRTRLCVNPAHMEIVTHRENLMRGVGAKLTEEDISAVRAAPSTVRTKDLAAQYGLSESHMSRVRRGIPRSSR